MLKKKSNQSINKSRDSNAGGALLRLYFGGSAVRDKRQETRDKRQETRDKRDKRQETRDNRQETRDKRQETRDKRQETAVVE